MSKTPSQKIRTVALWIASALRAGEITATQAEGWARALSSLADEIGPAVASPAADTVAKAAMVGVDRLDAAYAERMLIDSLGAIRRLAIAAMKTAEKTELGEINQDACTIVDTMTALAEGMARPETINFIRGA